jgi:hypothetical protein
MSQLNAAILDTLDWPDIVPDPPDVELAYHATYDANASTAGAETGRRVAWAKYYKAMEDNAVLLRHNRTLLRQLARFALTVSQAEAVRVLDPELYEQARGILLTLSLRAAGQSIVDEVIAERREKSERFDGTASS